MQILSSTPLSSRVLPALLAFLVSLPLSACGKDGASGTAPRTTKAATRTVTIKNSLYDPQTVTVKVGETVKWVNKDAVQHSATRDATDPKFDTGLLAQGDESEPIAFDKESDATGWQYRCRVSGHDRMKGFVVVTK